MATYYGISTPTSDFIAHYGITGMKWGVRKQIQKPNVSKMPRSKAYQAAKEKLIKASKTAGSIAGAAGGIAGGILGGAAGGFAGGAIGGAAGSIAGGVASRIKNRELWKRGAPTKADHNRIMKNKSAKKKPSNSKLSNKDKEFVRGMNKSANKHGAIGALTLGGGALGGAIGAAKYIKQHPKEWNAYKKKYKQMSFKDRMKASYGRV